MKERPILFSGQMVSAILDGRKTQTRRIVKPQPIASRNLVHLPYRVGQRLWVRESCRPRQTGTVYYRADSYDYHYDEIRAGGTVPQWRPSIHMPRWASRITLEIVAVRVERLQEITEDDAKAEGCQPITHEDGAVDCGTRKTMFAKLWDEINAKRAPWASNPFVFVIEFKRFMVWAIEFRMTKDAKE